MLSYVPIFLNQQLIEKHTKYMKNQFSEKQMQMVVTYANKQKATKKKTHLPTTPPTPALIHS